MYKFTKFLPRGKNFHAAVAILGLLLMICWFGCNFNGEHVPVNDGTGWDGKQYSSWLILGPSEVIHSQLLVKYTSQRVLPSFTIAYAAKLLGISINTPLDTIHAFYIYNGIVFCIALLFLWLIAKHLKWDWKIFFLAFSALFLNFSILKYSTYYPILTDHTAFLFGLVIFYAYLKDKIFFLAFSILLASFVYPSTFIMSLPLLLFGITKNGFDFSSSKYQQLNTFFTFLIASCTTFLTFYFVLFANTLSGVGPNSPKEHLLWLLLPCVFIYLYFALKPLIDFRFSNDIAKKTNWLRIFLTITLWLTVKAIIFFLSHNKAGGLNIFLQLKAILLESAVNPFSNVVNHANYFGPVLLFTIFAWKKIAQLAKQMGLGLVLFLIGNIILSLGTESRQLINVWPIFALLTCEVLNRYKITEELVYIIVVMSLIISRFWLHINIKPWPWGNFLEFPGQMYFMNAGPWLSDLMYKVFLATTILAGFTIFLLYKQLRKID